MSFNHSLAGIHTLFFHLLFRLYLPFLFCTVFGCIRVFYSDRYGYQPRILANYPVFLIIASLAQQLPLFPLTFEILSEKSLVIDPESDLAGKTGPTLTAKAYLLGGIIFGCIWWIEPSILSRFLVAFVKSLSGTFAVQMCIIPPWWWGDFDKLRGWASWMDLLQWLGLLGVFFLFLFMKMEFNRNVGVRQSRTLTLLELGMVDRQTSP